MMKNNLKRFLLLLSVFVSGFGFGQTQNVSHTVDFNSGVQNMWGPSWSPFSIDKEVTLFDVPWNVSYNTGNTFMFSLAGQSFGAAFNGGFSGVIGSKISLEGFTTGSVEVDYPVDIDLDMSANNTYDQGDVVSIQTNFTVRPGYEINSLYPTAGEFKWDLYFQMAANASAQLCFFGCTTFPIIPSFNTGLQTINLATISGNGASTGGEIGAWWLGAADPNPFGQATGIAGWPYSLPPQYSGPYTQANLGSHWIPFQCHEPFFPITMGGPMGLSGQIDLPYVTTATALQGDDLVACGNSQYFNVNLEVFKLLGGILAYSPPPGPAIGQVLENLSGSVDVGPATISWNFFSASFDATIFNNQCFNFDPQVWAKFQFPVPVNYQIYNPVLNTTSAMSTSSIINIQLGNELLYKYPCYFQEMDIVPTYYINGAVNNFTNHTYDSIAFNFLMSAFEFGIEVPSVIVIPGFTIPEICLSVPYPCPTWSNPFKICWATACTPEIVVPPIIFGGVSESFGPLWSTTIPLGNITYDWYNNSWSLEGFSQYTKPAFKMIPNILGISNTHVDVNCYGDATGSINITTSAVSPANPYTYAWTNGVSTEDLAGIPAGPYEVIVYDANGCELFTGATILEPQQPLSITYTKTDKNCNGGPNDGSIDILVQGGTPGYTYSWSNGATSEDVGALAAGSYTVTVTDNKNCTKAITVIINEPNVLGQVAAVTEVLCFGDASGEIAVDTYGGVLPYQYSWTSGQTSEDISNLLAGNYTLTITDGNNCNSVQAYLVQEPLAPLALSSTAVDVNCFSEWTGSIDLLTTGGTAAYTYQWSNSLGIVLPYASEDLTNVPADDYSVFVVDSRGCSATLSQTIYEPTAPLSSAPVLVDILCFGDATGSIDPVISGGTSAYGYLWSTGATTAIVNGLSAGTYTLLLTDALGCTDNYNYILKEPISALGLVLTGVDILCFGDATGSVSSDVTGGSTPYSYLWSNSAISGNISSLIAGNYSLLVTDDHGCTISDNLTLIEPVAPLALSSIVTDVDCYGNNSGTIDLTVTGGTTPYFQLWSNSGTVILIDTTEDITNQVADIYEVLVTDGNGCTESLISTINEPLAPLAITGVVNDVNCFGLNDGAIDITVTGGTTAYSYLWSSGQTNEDLNGVLSGTYTVVVTDFNGCIESMTFNIIQPSAPLNVATFTDDVLCNGGSDGTIDSEVTGGTLPYSYLWSNGATTDNIIAVTAGNYTLTITDDQGCIAFTGATVNEPTTLIVTPIVLDASCYSYDDGEITLTISGGVQPYYFYWGNQNEILLNNPSETMTGLIAEDYFIRVRDENGCIVEQIVTVGEPEPFVATSIITDVLCFGGFDGDVDLSITGGTLPYLIVWSDGQTTEDAVNLNAGLYNFEITDNQGCIIKDTVTVNEPSLIQISYDLIPVSCIDQTDASIFVNPYGGTIPYNFLWNTGSTDQNAESLAPSMYDLTITDANLCSQTFSFEITMNYTECLNIPNTFTPNGDNYNDTWVIGNIDLYPNATVKVFNKWGNEIFSSNGLYEPWDGSHLNNPLPSEVYYYIIVLGNDDQNEYTGTITIIR